MTMDYGLNDFLSIHLSKRCNLKCGHCYQQTYESSIIRLDHIEKAVKTFQPKWIVLYGGEPMVETKTIQQILEKFPDKKYLIYTNGTIYNESILDRMDKIVVTIESFFYEEAIKYRNMTKKQHELSIEIVRKYIAKTEILHNIYPTSHDKYFYRMAKFLGIKVQSYPIILNSSDFYFDKSMLESGLFREMKPNQFPKIRLLEDGFVTRDMRGINILSHIDAWNASYNNIPLPISPKCKICKFFGRCPASSIFPHFVYDVLAENDNPHFCKLTEAAYGK